MQKHKISAEADQEKNCLDYISKKYNHKLTALAKKIIICEETAKDIVQESYLFFFKNISSYRKGATVYTYLYRIVINKSIDHLRKNNSHKKTNGKIIADKEYHEEDLDLKIVVREALEKLDVELRIPLILLEFENHDYESISKILDISLSNVKIRIFRARKKLFKIFEKMGVDNYVL